MLSYTSIMHSIISDVKIEKNKCILESVKQSIDIFHDEKLNCIDCEKNDLEIILPSHPWTFLCYTEEESPEK